MDKPVLLGHTYHAEVVDYEVKRGIMIVKSKDPENDGQLMEVSVESHNQGYLWVGQGGAGRVSGPFDQALKRKDKWVGGVINQNMADNVPPGSEVILEDAVTIEEGASGEARKIHCQWVGSVSPNEKIEHGVFMVTSDYIRMLDETAINLDDAEGLQATQRHLQSSKGREFQFRTLVEGESGWEAVDVSTSISATGPDGSPMDLIEIARQYRDYANTEVAREYPNKKMITEVMPSRLLARANERPLLLDQPVPALRSKDMFREVMGSASNLAKAAQERARQNPNQEYDERRAGFVVVRGLVKLGQAPGVSYREYANTYPDHVAGVLPASDGRPVVVHHKMRVMNPASFVSRRPMGINQRRSAQAAAPNPKVSGPAQNSLG